MIETTEKTYRIRQKNPKLFDESSFRTIYLTQGISAVVGCPRGEFVAGHCRTGTQIQTLIFDKTQFKTKTEVKTWIQKQKTLKIRLKRKRKLKPLKLK